jgi:hypothetical protein
MKRMGEHFEVVIFTASLSKYADPLLDELDIHKVISKRLFRESCVLHDGNTNYVSSRHVVLFVTVFCHVRFLYILNLTFSIQAIMLKIFRY